MKQLTKSVALMGLILALALVLGVISVEAKMIPRVDNFVILVDLSGSMFQKHAGKQEVKAVLVKKVLAAMNERIPPLGYTAAIQVFNPNMTLIGPGEYGRSYFEKEIDKLPVDGKIYGNFTPLGTEIRSLDNIMGQFSGKTAIIILSDGKVNQGEDPVKAARFIINEYTNICFHTISFADEATGEETLRSISRLTNCGTSVDGKGLLAGGAVMDAYVGEVFYLEVPDEVIVLEEVIPEVITVAPESISMQGVYFDFDKSDLKSNYAPMLSLVYDKLVENPQARAVIGGHTDSTGPAEYNQGLSERRANAVRDYLIQKGIAAERIEAVGYGMTAPLVSNLTPEGRAVNRRVDITVVQ
jgi:OOP family OmpA-OmpF porin